MNKKLLVTMLLIGFFVSASAQMRPNFGIDMKLKKDTFYMLERWDLDIELEYRENNFFLMVPPTRSDTFPEVRRVPNSNSIFVGIEISNKKVLRDSWHQSIFDLNSYMAFKDYAFQRKFVFSPLQKIVISYENFPPSYPFLQYGRNEIKVWFQQYWGKGYEKYYTDTKYLYIKPYTGQDLEVYEYLMKQDDPIHVFWPRSWAAMDQPQPYVHCEYILKNFPSSSFVDDAHITLAQYYFLESGSVQLSANALENVIPFLRLVKKHGVEAAKSSDPKIKAMAELYLTDGIFQRLNSYYRHQLSITNEDPAEDGLPPEILEEFAYPPKH